MTPLWQRHDLSELVCVVVGSSRGLGAALVSELFRSGARTILGVSRTPADRIAEVANWTVMGLYLHLELDIGCEGAATVLGRKVNELPPGPLLVIFNSACFESDVRDDYTLDFDMFERINRVAVMGLSNTLQATQLRFMAGGGKIVGISSINAIKPSVIDRLVAYPATKAYQSMALRALAVAWQGRVSVAVVHLGHIGGPSQGNFFVRALNPSYQRTAEWLVRKISGGCLPIETAYPPIYRFCYQYILKNVTDGLYVSALSRLISMAGFINRWIKPASDKKNNWRRKL